MRTYRTEVLEGTFRSKCSESVAAAKNSCAIAAMLGIGTCAVLVEHTRACGT